MTLEWLRQQQRDKVGVPKINQQLEIIKSTQLRYNDGTIIPPESVDKFINNVLLVGGAEMYLPNGAIPITSRFIDYLDYIVSTVSKDLAMLFRPIQSELELISQTATQDILRTRGLNPVGPVKVEGFVQFMDYYFHNGTQGREFNPGQVTEEQKISIANALLNGDQQGFSVVRRQ